MARNDFPMQGRNEGVKGARFSGCRIIMGAPNHCGGRRNVSTMSQVLSSTAYLLPKDLRFEHGGAKLVSCSGRHLTSLRPCAINHDTFCRKKDVKLFLASFRYGHCCVSVTMRPSGYFKCLFGPQSNLSLIPLPYLL